VYKNILVCLDNSDYANLGADLGISFAGKLGSGLTGCHVYAAELHARRFKQMEPGLPAKYQHPKELKRQRENHGVLISKGLEIIADSYTSDFESRCKAADVSTASKTMEGKNYLEIVRELEGGAYDLVILGALGLGVTEASRIGSVCERVVRRTRTDVLVVRDSGAIASRIVVAVDGSPNSLAGVRIGVALAKAFGVGLEAVSAYDPDFHYTAFRNIAGILSEEAGRMFKFKEQETLHEEIIDKGLAKIYQDYLDTAYGIAKDDGLEIETTLLSGKPYGCILDHVRKVKSALLITGRIGIHAAEGLDIGSNTENCLRQSASNMLITSQNFSPLPKN
jgi:nucleotide-binding universal stress UspA family protein